MKEECVYSVHCFEVGNVSFKNAIGMLTLFGKVFKTLHKYSIQSKIFFIFFLTQIIFEKLLFKYLSKMSILAL